VISLFTKVPVREALDLSSRHIYEEILRFLCHILTSSSFCFRDQFYDQTNWKVIGSTPSPVIANFYMEEFSLYGQVFHHTLF
jgi:hypothetical protein